MIQDYFERRKKISRFCLIACATPAFVVVLVSVFPRVSTVHTVHAITNISAISTEHWAWNDSVGWINFYDPYQNITVDGLGLTGYASSSAREISLDCASSPNGNICGAGGTSPQYRVQNDRCGNLSGWAWNEVYGWTSFCGTTNALQANTSTCIRTNANYKVTITREKNAPDAGEFHGYAWNDAIGWIQFNCADRNRCVRPSGLLCGEFPDPQCYYQYSNFRLRTAWTTTGATGTLESATIDTGAPGGAQLNSIMWRGSTVGNGSCADPNAGTEVKFQIAVSNNSSGPWNYAGPNPSNPTGSYYGPAPSGVPIPLHFAFHNNKRYFRYRVMLVSDPTITLSPKVDEIILNWSP